MTTYFITGVNKGIGKSLVELLTKDSNNLVIGTVRNEAKAQELLSLKLENLKLIYIDMADNVTKFKEQFKALESYAPNGVDVFIQNAAIVDPDTMKHSTLCDTDYFSTVFDVNVTGTVRAYQAIYPYLFKGNGTKKMVFIGSISGIIGEPSAGGNAYGLSKAAVHRFGTQVAKENRNSQDPLINQSVTLIIHPGVVETTMHNDSSRKALTEIGASYITTDDSARKLLKIINENGIERSGTLFDEEGEILPW
ncbi:uncharacterized oxidoreductase [[Candida] jaroonii]|uniref:Uncharacterized oxidoreductase n=1 Tax=[Candida] jaroonii TaxID=467808 RepID=A0ACA9Y212_9ASCO|nr:uncharacterized oxidoreductase [[Candida] jaroonii]